MFIKSNGYPNPYVYNYENGGADNKVVDNDCTSGLHSSVFLTGDKILGEVNRTVKNPKKLEIHLGSINIVDSKEKYIINLFAPGFKKEDLTIEIEGSDLLFKAKSSKELEKEFTLQEYSIYMFERLVKLPSNLDTINIKATYEAGILTVNFDKIITKITKIQIQ